MWRLDMLKKRWSVVKISESLKHTWGGRWRSRRTSWSFPRCWTWCWATSQGRRCWSGSDRPEEQIDIMTMMTKRSQLHDKCMVCQIIYATAILGSRCGYWKVHLHDSLDHAPDACLHSTKAGDHLLLEAVFKDGVQGGAELVQENTSGNVLEVRQKVLRNHWKDDRSRGERLFAQS